MKKFFAKLFKFKLCKCSSKTKCDHAGTAVRKEIELPMIVGGGIRTKQNIESAFAAGANLVVIGTAIEDDPEFLNTIKHINN